MQLTIIAVAAEDELISVEIGPVGEDLAFLKENFANNLTRRDHHRFVDAQPKTNNISILLPERVEPFPRILLVGREKVQVPDDGPSPWRRWVWRKSFN